MTYDAAWEVTIGLEIHIELTTNRKMFSPSQNRFGDEPNTNIHYVCTGQPGALPRVNQGAVDAAILLGAALNATVATYSRFDRKSYFYPDSPRNFQITQLEHPILLGGEISTEVEGKSKQFKINRAHLEDDAGMLKHFTSFTGVDYNRAGVPLIEVVSEPCMHSAADAVAYATTIRSIALYLGISDCNMEEGSLRIDANVSVRRKGEEMLRPKVEVKNMNSFNNLAEAINYEIERQITAYTHAPTLDHVKAIAVGTYRWDAEARQTKLMRKKEVAEDYRYFPEPNLLPIRLTPEYIAQVQKTLPELPNAKKARYIQTLGLTPYSADLLIADKKLADYYESGLAHCNNPRALCNWITVEFAGRVKELGKEIYQTPLTSTLIAKLVTMIDQGRLTGKIAKAVADEMVEKMSSGESIDPEVIQKSNPAYETLGDTGLVEKIVDEVLEKNPQSIADYKAGRERAFGFLVGQVMKQCQGKAIPEVVNTLLKDKISKL
jgi:aspartyl-tRNA(Asn)/glutamyl-tRNA(Gln) amidotransferase subunit B